MIPAKSFKFGHDGRIQLESEERKAVGIIRTL